VGQGLMAIPDVTALPRHMPTATRPVASYRPVDSGVGELGAGISNLGAGFQQIQEQEETERDQLERVQAKSAWLNHRINAQATSKKNDDYSTLPKTHTDELEKSRQSVLEGITNPQSRAIFEAETSADMAKEGSWANDTAFGKESDHQNATLNTDLEVLLENAYTVEDKELRDQILQNIQDRIDLHADNGFYGANGEQKAVASKKAAVSKFALNKIQMAPPEERADMLKGELKKFIDAPTRAKLKEEAEAEIKADDADRIESQAYAFADAWVSKGLEPDQAEKELRKVPVKLRDEARAEYTRQNNIKENKEKNDKFDTYQELAKNIDEDGLTYEQVRMAEGFDKLDDNHRDALKKRDYSTKAGVVPKSSDRIVLDKLIGLEQAGEWDEARTFFIESGHLLDESDYSTHSKSTQEKHLEPANKELYTNQQVLASKLKDVKNDNEIGAIKSHMEKWYRDYQALHEGKIPSRDEFNVEADRAILDTDLWFWEEGFQGRGAEHPQAIEKGLLLSFTEQQRARASKAYATRYGGEPDSKQLFDYMKAASQMRPK